MTPLVKKGNGCLRFDEQRIFQLCSQDHFWGVIILLQGNADGFWLGKDYLSLGQLLLEMRLAEESVQEFPAALSIQENVLVFDLVDEEEFLSALQGQLLNIFFNISGELRKVARAVRYLVVGCQIRELQKHCVQA